MGTSNNKVTGIILQARTGSHRLPEKMLLPFYEGKSILQLLLERFTFEIPEKLNMVLATTENPSDNRIEKLANDLNINVFRGAEENVLQRFIDAAEKYNFDRIIRICGDNPFFDMKGTLKLLEEYTTPEYDYVSFKVQNDKPAILSHLGFWGEIVRLDALKKAFRQTDEKKHLEHVTNFIYLHPEQFRIELLKAPNNLADREDIRLTVDTREDFDLNREIYRHLIENQIPLIPSQIVNFIDAHPDLKNRMSEQIVKNKK